jgi:hypothetical protein
MACLTNKFRKSTITALVASGFFVSMFFLSLATPEFYYDLVYGGIAVSSLMTIYYWWLERRVDSKASPVGMWILLGIFLLFILVFCIIALG